MRDIASTKPYQTAPYWNEKYKYLNDQQWYESVKKIKAAIDSKEPCDELAKMLYKTLCEASVAAGAKLQRHPPAPYSEDIHQLRIIVRLHKLIISQLQLAMTYIYIYNSKI